MMQERERSHTNQPEVVGQVVAGTAVEPDAAAVLAGDDAASVVFDLVQPAQAHGWALGAR